MLVATSDISMCTRPLEIAKQQQIFLYNSHITFFPSISFREKVVKPYCSTNAVTIWNRFCFVLWKRSVIHMINKLSTSVVLTAYADITFSRWNIWTGLQILGAHFFNVKIVWLCLNPWCMLYLHHNEENTSCCMFKIVLLGFSWDSGYVFA